MLGNTTFLLKDHNKTTFLKTDYFFSRMGASTLIPDATSIEWFPQQHYDFYSDKVNYQWVARLLLFSCIVYAGYV